MEALIAAGSFIMENAGLILMSLLAIVGAFAQLATLTPNTADDVWTQKALDAINWLARNTGKSKNG